MKEKILITGAGGFIGGHLTKKLLDEGLHAWDLNDRSPCERKKIITWLIEKGYYQHNKKENKKKP